MKLIKTKEDVDKIMCGEFCFIQCPKTGVIHKMTPTSSSSQRKIFYHVTQSGGTTYVINDAYPRGGDGRYHEQGRYHFTKEKLKELIESKAFTIER